MSNTDVGAITGMMGGFSFASSAQQQADVGCDFGSACGSVFSASDCNRSTNSFILDAPCGIAGFERGQGFSATSGISWRHSVAGGAGPAGPDVACQASVFFANENSTAVAVGCPCKTCVKTVATTTSRPPAVAQRPAQPWQYQRPEQRSNDSPKCYSKAFAGRSQVTFGDAWAGDAASPTGTPANAVASPEEEEEEDETLRTLLLRAKQDFTATAAVGAGASRGADPSSSQQAQLRRTAPGGIIRPVYAHGPAPPTYRRRMEARSTSPIPVPSPPLVSGRASTGSGAGAGPHHHHHHHQPRVSRAPPAAAAQSTHVAGEALWSDGGRDRSMTDCDEAAVNDVVRVEDLQHNKMLRAIMQMYDRIREQRAKRPPGRPDEPLSVVVGFEPKSGPQSWAWPAGGSDGGAHVLVP